MIALALFSVLTYEGSRAALLSGYICGVMAGSMLAPAAGALLTELFPTSVRASVAGWWVVAGVLGAGVGLLIFGTVADVGNQFALAAELTFLPAALFVGLFWLLPETLGREPEDLWPTPIADGN
jgi:MFS family permease